MYSLSLSLSILLCTGYFAQVLQENTKLYDGEQDMKALCNTPQCRLKFSVKTNRPNQGTSTVLAIKGKFIKK